MYFLAKKVTILDVLWTLYIFLGSYDIYSMSIEGGVASGEQQIYILVPLQWASFYG